MMMAVKTKNKISIEEMKVVTTSKIITSRANHLGAEVEGVTTKTMTEIIGKRSEDHIVNILITAVKTRAENPMITISNSENKCLMTSQKNSSNPTSRIEL